LKFGGIDNIMSQNLYQKSVDFSGKTKSLIDYLKKFEADKKKK